MLGGKEEPVHTASLAACPAVAIPHGSQSCQQWNRNDQIKMFLHRRPPGFRCPVENPFRNKPQTPSPPVFPCFSPRASLAALFTLPVAPPPPGSARQWIYTFPSVTVYLCPISATRPARRKETAPEHRPPRPQKAVQHGPWLHNASQLTCF